MQQPGLLVRDLRFAYPDGRLALDGITCAIEPGEAVGVIGSNGAGKSTLLHLLLGLITPQGGAIALDGLELEAKNLREYRRRLGLVFQNPDDQLFSATVGEDVAFGPIQYGMEPAEVETCVTSALAACGIKHLRNRSPFRLSLGEKRLAALASILAMRPDYLILDEPSSSLDPVSRRRLIQLLRNTSAARLITSHDLEMIHEICPRVIVLREGKIAASGPTAPIIADASLMRSCGLETPASLAICPRCGHNPLG